MAETPASRPGVPLGGAGPPGRGLSPRRRRALERELQGQMRAAAGRLLEEIRFLQRAGRVDAPNAATQLRMVREDVGLAIGTCEQLDHRARAG